MASGDSTTNVGSIQVDQPILPFALKSVYLRKSDVYMVDTFDPLLPAQMLKGMFRTTDSHWDCRETKNQNQQGHTVRSCAFTRRFEFAYRTVLEDDDSLSDDEIEKLIVAQIVADITVDYILISPDPPDEKTLAKWGERNAVVHAWPYWREYCHSMMMRMGLPTTTIPLIQLTKSDNSTGSADAQD